MKTKHQISELKNSKIMGIFLFSKTIKNGKQVSDFWILKYVYIKKYKFKNIKNTGIQNHYMIGIALQVLTILNGL